MNMHRFFEVAAIAAVLAASSPAFAHGPKTGAHGGQQADAGVYHAEVVVTDRTIDVYLVNHASAPVPTTGFKGTAILVIDTATTRVALEPTGDNRLTGAAAVALTAPIKGVVRIEMPDGAASLAKF